MGYKYRSKELKKNLLRDTARNTRSYNHGILCDPSLNQLVMLFDKSAYDLYSHYYQAYGTPGRKRQVMLNKILKDNISGPVKELAELRVKDLYIHQKLLQILRFKWTDIVEYEIARINNNPDKFWRQLTGGVIGRCKTSRRTLYIGWQGVEGRIVFENYLKDMYIKQQGLCAITKVPLELKVKSGNNCSIDRIDSNKGYEPGNIWLTLGWVNIIKFDADLDTFLKRVSIIYKANNA